MSNCHKKKEKPKKDPCCRNNIPQVRVVEVNRDIINTHVVVNEYFTTIETFLSHDGYGVELKVTRMNGCLTEGTILRSNNRHKYPIGMVLTTKVVNTFSPIEEKKLINLK